MNMRYFAIALLVTFAGCSRPEKAPEASVYRSAFREAPRFFENRWGSPKKVSNKGNVLAAEWSVDNTDVLIEFRDQRPLRIIFTLKNSTRWNDEQLVTALGFIASKWERLLPDNVNPLGGFIVSNLAGPTLDVTYYKTPEGDEARRASNRLEILSGTLVRERAAQKEAEARRRNAVPRL